jgi:soluble lytic murein transglycosylase
MRWRFLGPSVAGTMGLALAALGARPVGIDSPRRPAKSDTSSLSHSADAATSRAAHILAATKDIRWFDALNMGGAMQTRVAPEAAHEAMALPYAAVENTPDAPPPTPETLGPAVTTPDAFTWPTDFDPVAARDALKAYRTGDIAAGDQLARAAASDLQKLTLEWATLRLQPRLTGFGRINAFLDAHPDWPGAPLLRRRAEEALYSDRTRMGLIRTYFAARPPQSPVGKLALARAQLAEGKTAEATAIVRAVWRQEELGSGLEAAVRKEFGILLSAADHKYRADRLFYREKEAAAIRAAGYAGNDVLALNRARAAITENAKPDKLVAAVPKALQADPSLAYARIQKLRRDNKFAEAAKEMFEAPRDPAVIVDGDAWWVERRLLARKLLDTGDAKTAFRIVSEHSAVSAENIIDAEFHIGWIALRFLAEPANAEPHFVAALKIAETPMSRSRASYWLGRALEAQEKADDAKAAYETAAAYSGSYYGQLARARLGLESAALRLPARIAMGDERLESVRVVEALLGLGENELALGLAADAARKITDEPQLAALAQTMIAAHDARGALMIGKLAAPRGFALDDAAFPIFGIPAFEPASNSAEMAIVYAIARQESAFQANAVSSAGARGLMQMIASTAARTAKRVGAAFDVSRLTSDPAFNARLGAAHLGDLLTENSGSMILTFVAYNAGGRRVKEWIAAYGDPRKPDVDPIDWVERIPFNETRNYVQRVSENLEMYRIRFGGGARVVGTDLRTVAAQL